MKRLTTDDTTSILQSLNLFFAKDAEVWIRGGGPEPDYQDCTLVDWINRAAAAQGIELEADDAETMGDIMYDCLQFGWDATEGILALLHAAAVQAAEMRGRLKLIEDILGDDYDLDRLDVILSQCITLREDVAERMKLVGGIPIDRLREMVKAMRENRCIQIDKGYRIIKKEREQDG